MPLIAIPGHPKRLSFPDGHSMGQQTQTPAEGFRAHLARNETGAILDRCDAIREPPACGVRGVLCSSRLWSVLESQIPKLCFNY